MIKFFRHIRRSLINQNNMGKYFKYALGEIILVMIGILLALQVNNWNELRKSKRAKSVYIDRLINDLKSDTTAFSFNMNTVQRKVDDSKYIMSVINENETIVDNKVFVLRLQNIGRINVPNKARNTFADLQVSGNLKLFNNDSMVKSIRAYYVTEIDYWSELYINRTTEGYLPIITEILPFNLNEEIVNSEIKQNTGLKPLFNYDRYEVSVLDEDLELIIEKINRQHNFDFHLKNAARAHMLQLRVLRGNYDQANRLIKLLKDYKK